jgi:transposase
MRPKLKVTPREAPGVVMKLMEEAGGKRRRKLKTIYLAMSGRFTTDEIAEKVGCSRSSVTNWVRLYREGSLFSLFRTHYKPTRMPSLDEAILHNVIHHMTYSLVPNNVRAMQKWLKTHYKIDLTLPGVRYWWDRLWEIIYQPGYEYPESPPEVVLPYSKDEDWYSRARQ